MRIRTNAKDSAITIATARSQMLAMLANARSVDSFTVEGLARSYRLPLREIEYHLTIERQRRTARA